jgi:hypothetical protein
MTQLDDPLPADVLSAIQRGKATLAVKLLRESKGLGWKEARDIVNQRLRSGKAPGSGVASAGWLPAAIAAALRSDDPADALRSMRDSMIAAASPAKAVDKPATPKPPPEPRGPSGLAPGEVPRSNNRLWLTVLAVALLLLLHLAFRRGG